MKLLPVEGSGGAAEQILPAQWVVTGARSADTGTDVNLGFSSGDHTSTEDTAPTLNSLDLPSLADARMRALDRTQDMMALHSMRLVESKMDALSVIIKPAIGTELSLDLRQQADGVEAHATLLRGDHQFLSEQWPSQQLAGTPRTTRHQAGGPPLRPRLVRQRPATIATATALRGGSGPTGLRLRRIRRLRPGRRGQCPPRHRARWMGIVGLMACTADPIFRQQFNQVKLPANPRESLMTFLLSPPTRPRVRTPTPPRAQPTRPPTPAAR